MAEAKTLDHVLSGHEIADQNGLFIDETITSCASAIRLRHDRIVADTAHLHPGWYDDRDVGSSAVGGIVVKREPTRRIHQIGTFLTYVGEAFVCDRPTFR